MSQTPDAYHDDAHAEDEALERARRTLRTYREGTLHFDGHFIPTPFVTEAETGKLVMPVPEACFFAHEHIFFVPEEAEDALQLLLSPERIEECLLTDVWHMYHGEPEQIRWASCYVDAAKLMPWVFDGDALMLTDRLAGEVPWLTKALNDDRAALARATAASIGRDVDEARGVGVDERGVYVRVRFGVVRLEFDTPATTGQDAHERITALLERARG